MVNASSAERGHIARVSGGGIYSAVLKGIVKIALVMLKRNIDEGLRGIFVRSRFEEK